MTAYRFHIALIFLLLGITASYPAGKQECAENYLSAKNDSCKTEPITTVNDKSDIRIYFRRGYSNIDLTFRNNKSTLDSLLNIINEAHSQDRLHAIYLQAWASPEGDSLLNAKLALKRTNILSEWILKRTDIPEEKIFKTSGGVGWNLLREAVAVSDMHYRDKVVDIIDNTPIWVFDNNGHIVAGRKKELMNLKGGTVWRDMDRRFFPDIRCNLAIIIRFKEPKIVVPENIKYINLIAKDTMELPERIEPIKSPTVEQPHRHYPPYIALKSNLLEDVLLIPNIGIEFYLGKNWTVGGSWAYAWWKSDRKHNYWRIYGGELNARKYFGRKAKEKPLQGHHIGAYAQAYTYDFELCEKGIMGGVPGGDIFDKLNYGFGIEYGYSHPIARRFNLDFSIGVGYFGGEYREYIPQDDCYVYQTTKQRHYWGPTKAEISLVWLLGRGNTNPTKRR